MLHVVSRYGKMARQIKLELISCYPFAATSLNFTLVRDLTTWTILQNDDPNHLGMRCNALPGHQMALITSVCAPSVVGSRAPGRLSRQRDAPQARHGRECATTAFVLPLACRVLKKQLCVRSSGRITRTPGTAG